MGIISRFIFGHEVGIVLPDFDSGETIEESVYFEEEDEKADIDDARDAWIDEDVGFAYGRNPPKQRVWWRL